MSPIPRLNYWREVRGSRRAAIENFCPHMFSISMGTGILSTLLWQNPHQFSGLHVIATILWILNILLFAGLIACFGARWYFQPKATAKMFDNDVEQSAYLSTISVAAVTIVQMVMLVCGSSWKKWQYVSFALWWMNVVVSLASAFATYWLVLRDKEVDVENFSPTLMYPTTALLATGSSGGILLTSTPLSITLSTPVLIVSFAMLGAGLFLCIPTLSVYFLRLINKSTPSPNKAAPQLVPVAPFANASLSFVSLSYLAGPSRNILQLNDSGPVSAPDFGNAIYGAGFLFGILFWGFATFWLLLTIIAFFRDLPRSTFNVSMWALAYPIGVYGLAAAQLAIALDSPAYRVFTSIIAVSLVIIWLALMVYTVLSVASGEMLLKDIYEERQKKLEEGEKEQEMAPARDGPAKRRHQSAESDSTRREA